MKNTLIAFVLAIAFLAPSFSYAQTPSQDEVRDQYQATLVQLITLLQQQVQILMSQLVDLKDKQDVLANDVKTVKDNTTKPTGTAEDNVVTPPAHTVSWDDTRAPYYQSGLVYLETTVDVSTSDARLIKLHTDGASPINLSFAGKEDQGNGYFLYFFTPASNLTKGSYSVYVLKVGHALGYDDKGIPEYDYSIRLEVQ